jgi:hypothetical protein
MKLLAGAPKSPSATRGTTPFFAALSSNLLTCASSLPICYFDKSSLPMREIRSSTSVTRLPPLMVESYLSSIVSMAEFLV